MAARLKTLIVGAMAMVMKDNGGVAVDEGHDGGYWLAGLGQQPLHRRRLGVGTRARLHSLSNPSNPNFFPLSSWEIGLPYAQICCLLPTLSYQEKEPLLGLKCSLTPFPLCKNKESSPSHLGSQMVQEQKEKSACGGDVTNCGCNRYKYVDAWRYDSTCNYM